MLAMEVEKIYIVDVHLGNNIGTTGILFKCKRGNWFLQTPNGFSEITDSDAYALIN